MDRGAWWATVHKVAKSWTWLKRWSMHIITLSCFTGRLPVTELFFWGLMFFLHLGHIPLLCYFVLTFCDCIFHSSVCRVVVLASTVCPWWMRLYKTCVGFLVESRGLVPAPWWVELGLVLWWSGPCQGMFLTGSCMLRKTSNSLSDNGWGYVPCLLVFGQSCPSTGA